MITQNHNIICVKYNFVCFSYQIPVCPWTESLEKMEKALLCSCSGQSFFFLLLYHCGTVVYELLSMWVFLLISTVLEVTSEKNLNTCFQIKVAMLCMLIQIAFFCGITMFGGKGFPEMFYIFACLFIVWFNRMQVYSHIRFCI